MEYKIIETGSLPAMMTEVNKHIEEGWRPQGRVVVKWYPKQSTAIQSIYHIPAWNYLQAMMRSKPNDDTE